MIGQNSNNKATGFTAKACDPGIPISGRTDDTGTYEIIKTLADGTIAGFPNALTGAIYIGYNFSTFGVPGGLPPANTYLGSSSAIAVTTAGQYNVNPILIYPGNPGGAISFVLYKDVSNMATYFSTLPPFNAFSPNTTDVSAGMYGYWHASTSQQFGGQLMYSYNRNNTLSVNLGVGTYYLAAITDGAVSTNAGAALIGVTEFAKIG
jgi:hypothetical protein